jgi:hypothetical protein
VGRWPGREGFAGGRGYGSSLSPSPEGATAQPSPAALSSVESSPSAAVSLVRALREHSDHFGVTGRAPNRQQLQFEGESDGYKKTAQDAPNLPLRPLVTRFGVTLHVHMPAGNFGSAEALVNRPAADGGAACFG